ncbi:cytidine deaminase [Trichosporon asahii var. asahii CBS 8904]|uniref:Cytidine deaminase n=1 Tax=Trichosporon asahii var. asahii (strain CBS 8904) TaxID=1220162 RepID=K1VE12_TRIAC|nr:cytidine deaminase [Trichosporon asahii var. asahii CBS 8904]
MTAMDPAKLHRLAQLAFKTDISVGASLLLSSGEMIGGCNVENASFLCAERNAIGRAVSEHGKIEVAAVVVVSRTPAHELWTGGAGCSQGLKVKQGKEEGGGNA